VDHAAGKRVLVYREVQHFSPFVVGGTIALLAVALALIALLGPSSPGQGWAPPALAAVIMVAAASALLMLRLVTEVDSHDVRVRLAPFQPHGRVVVLADVAAVRPLQYSPLRDYGGWGIRKGRTGWAYNARGDRGVLLTLGSGDTLLIGSQQPERLAAALAAGVSAAVRPGA